MNTFVVVPAHDEATTVGDVVRRARRHAPVIVVDDGSTDGTPDLVAALRTGVAAARARGATHVVTLDADGQHDSDDVPALLAAAAPRTLVVGARLYGDAALPPGRAEAIVVAGFFVNWASGLRLIDTQSGFRVYPLEIFDEVSAHHGGFVFETEVLLAAAGHGWTIREVPVRALPRVAARSRFRPVVDGIAIGAHLAGRSIARGAREVAAAGGEIASVVAGRLARERHAALLETAAPYAGGMTWGSSAVGSRGGGVIHGRVARWRRRPRCWGCRWCCRCSCWPR